MKQSWLTLGVTLGLALSSAPAAWADNIAHCEVLLMQTVDGEDANGEFQIASYRPAVSFIASVYDEAPDHETQIDGHAIKALLCRRSNIVPSETDYAMIATGIPFILSQDFDSTETDSLTMYWKDGKIEHVYKGQPLSEAVQVTLETRLADFSERGLNDMARAAKAAAVEETAEDVSAETSMEISEETPMDVSIETSEPHNLDINTTDILTDIEIQE